MNLSGIAVFDDLVYNFNKKITARVVTYLEDKHDPLIIEMLRSWYKNRDDSNANNVRRESPDSITDSDLITELRKRNIDYWRTREKDVVTCFQNLTVQEKKDIYHNNTIGLFKFCTATCGQYFLNMSMLFDHLNHYSDKKESLRLGNLFKAQLSQAELTVLYVYNDFSECPKQFKVNCDKYNLLEFFDKSTIFGL